MVFKFSELNVYVVSGLLLLIMTINYDSKLFLVFGGMILVDYMIFAEMGTRLNLNQIPRNSLRSLFLAAISLTLFFFINILAVSYLQGLLPLEGKDNLGSVLRAGFLATGLTVDASGAPVLFRNSLWASLIVFGLVVAVIETRFAGRLLEYVGRVSNVDVLDWKSFRAWFAYAFIGFFMVVLHFAVKGVQDNVALLGTFIFFAGSCFLMAYTKELESATLLHGFNNFLVILKTARFV